MELVLEERRQRRSSNQTTALCYQLELIYERGDFEAVVLADDAGLVLASAGDEVLCDELGAFAPLMYRTVLGMTLPPLLEGAELSVRPTRVYGQSIFLAAIGGDAARELHLVDTVRAVERILTIN